MGARISRKEKKKFLVIGGCVTLKGRLLGTARCLI
jgi:hypothetical protein